VNAKLEKVEDFKRVNGELEDRIKAIIKDMKL
jgi:hypothetical protein